MLDESDRALMQAVSRYLEHVNERAAADQTAELTPVGQRIADHLGADPTAVSVVSEQLADHRLVDADLAFEQLGDGQPDALLGIAGGDGRLQSSMDELVANTNVRWSLGAVSYSARATGPDTTRQVVSFGLRLLTFEDLPIAIVQRAANPQYGRQSAELEVMGTDSERVTRFLERLRALMVERSVLRGQVLSFVRTEYGSEAGATFLPRPDVSEDDIVLTAGVLDEVVQHVVGIGEQRAALLAAGQHLKRGVLLYGPPGTGKTLTIRHLLSRTPGVTAVLLTGSSIAAIGAAAEIARTFQPSIVVLEDIDLVAMERHSSPQPLLFEVLDALDGLDGDADVAFVMTTNRVKVLERALADRPGRVDLAVEIPLPGADERLRLFRRYAGDLPFSDAALEAAAAAADGTTGSFAKELMRRSVLAAALSGTDPTDEDLASALDSLLSARAALTRRLLGARRQGSERAIDGDDGGDDDGDDGGDGDDPVLDDTGDGAFDGGAAGEGSVVMTAGQWHAYAPLAGATFGSDLVIHADPDDGRFDPLTDDDDDDDESRGPDAGR